MSYTPKNPNGQDVMADSSPVVIASDQSAVPVDLGVNNDVTVTSGAITETNSAAIKTAVETLDNAVSGAGFNITQIGGAAAPIGAGLEATAVRVTLPTDGTGKVGLIAGTANIGDVDILSIAAGDNNIGNVDIVTMPSVTVTGVSTLAEQQTQTTALQLIDDMVVAQGTALGTTKLCLNGASVTTANPTYTTGQISPLNMATTGALRVDVGATSANATAIKVNVASGGIASGAIASGAIAAGAIAAGATSIATTEDTASAAADHLVKIASERLDTPVANANVSNDGDYLQVLSDNFGKIWVSGTVPEDTAHIGGESIQRGGVRRIDTAATSAGSSGDWATMDASAEGAVWVTATPTTTSGLSVANFNSGDTYTALTSTAQVIKASAGNLYGYYIYNPNSTATYVMLYNIAAASVTVGTSTALMVFCIPATAAANLMMPYPISFSNAGWSIAAATTGGGNSAPATALEAMIWYK